MFEFSTKKAGENYCCCHKPLLNIPLEHVILDELHIIALFKLLKMYQFVKNKLVLIHEQINIIFLMIKGENTIISLTIKINYLSIILTDKKDSNKKYNI